MADFRGFVYRTLVYIGDATPFGQAYFARYFEWQGKAREEFFRAFLPTAREVMETFRIVAWETSVRYKRELPLHEPVAIEVRITEVTKASAILHFTYRHADEGTVAAEGAQRLVFTDQHGRIVPLPDEVRRRAVAYQHTCDAA
jgi:acyl-CoA thioesterase FadM